MFEMVAQDVHLRILTSANGRFATAISTARELGPDFERTRKAAGWGALGIVAAAWAAESTPEGMAWGILAVVAVVLHVVRTWRS
ncbi:hypothetical protein [Nocardiopsis listeri]|uniref:hypothetical protein n=1 Tax=Nocardiopsis listeri TaxID=53440 RepID=UPI00082F1D0B|nr:hypothetical protein [Nocardiopsis listeri]